MAKWQLPRNWPEVGKGAEVEMPLILEMVKPVKQFGVDDVLLILPEIRGL